MIRRGPIIVNRRKGPGLLGTMAVGGMAYAAGSSMASRSAQNQQIVELQVQQDTMMAQQQAMVQQPPQAYALLPQAYPADPAPPSTPPDRVSQFKRLAELKAMGLLTEEEFQQEKQRILAAG